MVKYHLPVQETWVRSLGWEDPQEKEMTTHSSILAWIIPWTEKPGGLQFMGSQRVGHNWVTNTFIFPCMESTLHRVPFPALQFSLSCPPGCCRAALFLWVRQVRIYHRGPLRWGFPQVLSHPGPISFPSELKAQIWEIESCFFSGSLGNTPFLGLQNQGLPWWSSG